MAFHITRKEAKATFHNLIAIGYCEAQELIKKAGVSALHFHPQNYTDGGVIIFCSKTKIFKSAPGTALPA